MDSTTSTVQSQFLYFLDTTTLKVEFP